MYYEVGSDLAIPRKSSLAATTNVDTVVELLSRAVGIVDNVHEPPASQSRPALSANVKHSLAFSGCMKISNGSVLRGRRRREARKKYGWIVR